MKKLLNGIRLALLVTALAFFGVGMMPAESSADHATCDGVGCPGGANLCDFLVHDDGTTERCTITYNP